MDASAKGKHRLGFGLFEVDVPARELYKRGHRVHLQDQPFQILAALLERAGEVVTREQLRKKLWPDDTFVDFDEGLNTAMKKLRYALGDSTDNPIFVETIPRRGSGSRGVRVGRYVRARAPGRSAPAESLRQPHGPPAGQAAYDLGLGAARGNRDGAIPG